METHYACNHILPRWGQYGYQQHKTLESARAEAKRTIDNRDAAAVEIIRIEQIGSGPSCRFSHTLIETVTYV